MPKRIDSLVGHSQPQSCLKNRARGFDSGGFPKGQRDSAQGFQPGFQPWGHSQIMRKSPERTVDLGLAELRRYSMDAAPEADPILRPFRAHRFVDTHSQG